jgi:hypothetical protein
MPKKAMPNKKKQNPKLLTATSSWPRYISVPGHPDEIEVCDWDPVNNEPSCKIIPRSQITAGPRVTRAGAIPGLPQKFRAARRGR